MKKLIEPLFGVANKRNQIRERTSGFDPSTESLEKLLKLISSVVKLPGLRGSFVPSLRTLRRLKSEFESFFTSLLEPEQTYSGFGVSLVFNVRHVVYILLSWTDFRG